MVVFILFAALGGFFAGSHTLGLEQVQRQGQAHVKAFAAKPAAHWKLKKSDARDV
jgi:hypothetical protein